jgi:hypothetical protein
MLWNTYTGFFAGSLLSYNISSSHSNVYCRFSIFPPLNLYNLLNEYQNVEFRLRSIVCTLLSRRRSLLISLVVLSSTLVALNVRFAWYGCTGADSYSRESLARACQFIVSSGHYSISKHLSRSSVSYSFISPVDR